MKGALDAKGSSGHCGTKAHGSVKRTIFDLMRPRKLRGLFYIYDEMNFDPKGQAVKTEQEYDTPNERSKNGGTSPKGSGR